MATAICRTLLLGNIANSSAEEGGTSITAATSIIGGDASNYFSVVKSTFDGNGTPIASGSISYFSGNVSTVGLRTVLTNAAIDAGDDSAAPAQDARGVDRDADFPDLANNDGNVSDLCAFELGPIETPSLIVTTTSDYSVAIDGETSLRGAIGHVAAGRLSGTITFADGVRDAFENGGQIYLSGGALELTGNLTIDGDLDDDGTADITIDAQGQDRVFLNDGGFSNLTGLVITGGDTSGIASTNKGGGGIFLGNEGTLYLTDSVVTGNTAATYEIGGGIASSTSNISQTNSLLITNSEITNNSATQGGGISAIRTDLTLTTSEVSSNTATTQGGVIYNGDYSSLVLTGSTLSGNSANSGGAIGTNGNGDVVVNGSTLSDNSANLYGGGLYLRDDRGFGTDVRLTNVTIEGNTAGTLGGGIHSAADLYLTHVTATGNSDGGSAAGNYADGGLVDATNSIFLGNEGSSGFVAVKATLQLAGNVLTGNAADVFEAIDGTTGGGQLADNGGLVQTVALNADVANLAIDAATAVAGLTTDANGNARDVDIPGADNGGTVDAGAVEVQAVQEAASLIVTTASDVVDQFDCVTSLREAIGHVNDGTLSGTITFAGVIGETFGAGGTITLGGTSLALTSDITIDGNVDGDGASDVTVDAGDLSRVFSAFSGDSVLQALAISGGDNATFGGGEYVSSSASLTLDRSIVQDNSATVCAGLFNNGGTLTLIDSLVTDNSTNGVGAAVSSRRAMDRRS